MYVESPGIPFVTAQWAMWWGLQLLQIAASCMLVPQFLIR
jgi:hypothetical protein